MLLGLAAALVATVCYGLASVFQARGATGADGRRPTGAARVLVSGPFLLGILLDIAGFGFSVIALRRLTLFAVQAVTSASLAVTAVAAARLLALPLRRRDTAAIGAVCAGLVLLALGSGPEGRTVVGTGFHLGVLLTAIGAVLLAVLLARTVRGGAAAMPLGLLAGTAFGMVSVAVRVLDSGTLAAALADPAAYALPAGGLGGYLCYALALQRGAVTAITSAVIVGETLVPGLVGVVALGDRARPGFGWAALLGFALALAGTFALGRFAELPAPAPLAPAVEPRDARHPRA